MADLEQISRLTVEAKQTGLDAVAAGFDKVAAAQTKAAAAGESVVVVTETQTKSQIGIARALENSARAYDPLSNAMAKIIKLEREQGVARQQGIPIAEGHHRALQLLREKYDNLVRPMNDNTTAHGLNRMQMMESMHVAKSLFDEIASGASPFRALAVEGGRIGEIFAMGNGGVGGTLRAFGSTLAGFISPLALAAGAVAGLAVAGGAAYLSFSNGQDKLARSLEGVGRASGVSLGRLNSIADAGAKAGGISNGAGRDLAATYSGSGVLDGSQIGGLIAGTKAYARALGTDLPTAAERLASAMKDPSKGAADLNKELGFLDSATLRQIEDMQRSGNLMGAQNLLLEKQAAAVATVTDRAWSLSHAWESVKSTSGDAIDYVGGKIAKLVEGPSTSELLKYRLGDQEEYRSTVKFGNSVRGLTGQKLLPQSDKLLEDQIIALQYKLGAEAQRPYALQQEQTRNRLSLEAQPIVDRNNDEPEKLRKLVQDRALLNDAMQKGIDLGPGAAGAFERLNSQINNFTFSAQRAAQEGDLQVRSIQAWTLSEKIAVDVERARTAAVNAGKDALTTSIDAENARNAAIARANDTASKALISAKDQLSLVGLNPHDRAVKEREIKYRDLQEQNILDKGDTTGLRIKGDQATAGGATSPAIQALAQALQAGNVPGGFGRVTAFNDEYHQGTGSQHAKGLAGDFTLNDPSQSAAAAEYARGLLRSRGYADNQFRVIDEYASPSARATGGHIHYQLNGDGGGPATAAVAGTGNGDLRQAKAADALAQNRSERDVVIKAANDNIERQNKLLDVQISTFGKSTYEINRAAKAQELMNQFAEQGVPVNGALRQSIDSIADATGALAQKQEDAKISQQKLIAGMDDIRGIARGALGTFVDDLTKGKSGAVALRDALAGVGQKLLSLGEDAIIANLFGKSGTGGGGLFGGFLSSLFGGGGLGGGAGGIGHAAVGTDFSLGGPTWVGEKGPEVVNLPRGANVVPNHKLGGGSNVVSINSRGGDVIIHGNADSVTVEQLKGALAAETARQDAQWQRNMGGMQSSFNKQYG